MKRQQVGLHPVSTLPSIVTNPAKQSGAIALMTMMMMLAVTFTALFVMEMAILEETTVSNEQRGLQVYQTAYGELEAQLEFLETNPGILNAALTGDQTLTSIVNPAACTVPAQACLTVSLSYLGEFPPPPGFSLSKYVGRMFEINSVALLVNVGARSDQTLAFTYVTPRAGG